MTLKLNRPRSLDPSIITIPIPQPLHSLDSKQIFDNLFHQCASAKLTLILDKLADSSYGSRMFKPQIALLTSGTGHGPTI